MLPRGSDLFGMDNALPMVYFNPRSLAGATRMLRLLMLDKEFQSTLPRGSDYWLIWNEWFRDEFQSTLPRGSDA